MTATSPAKFPLLPRVYRHTARFRRSHPAAKAFLAPQRPRPAKIQHPKPVREDAR